MQARPSFAEFGRTAQAHLPLSLWPPGSDLSCPATYCTSEGLRSSIHNKQFLRYSGLYSLQSPRESPRVMRACPVYDGLQSPHSHGLARSSIWTSSCYRGSRHSGALCSCGSVVEHWRKKRKWLWVQFPGNTHTGKKMYRLNAL